MIGSRLGAYEILAELGSGGMGKVYQAQVAKAAAGLDAGTAVALKVIHGHLLETEGFFKRFLREAQIGQDVQHENVVRCFDCDATLLDGASQHYLVMEYVEGQTLRDLLVELDRVPEELCRHIGREVAKGLAAIHAAGVVHRDLKPENVLITPDHVVKVMDLGVARLTDEAIRLSRTGTFLGSLEYAAPEQFTSAGGEPDGRADLHALGVVLYELSTGQHPYRDDQVSKVLRNILDVMPRKVGEVNPRLSPFFEEVVHNLIAKDRGDRFATASELATALAEGEKSDWWGERATALRSETKRPLRRVRVPRETALYGRDDDLAKLHDLYERAKAGDGQVLLIEGEAGIGKTRLVDEFVGRLRQEGEDVNFLFGSYPPGGAATATGAFAAAYREHFGAGGLEDELRMHLQQTPNLVPAFAALLRGESATTGTAPLSNESLYTVFVHATQGLAAERTTVVLIDDLHFAPGEGRALFSALAMAVPGHRILLLGTMRPGIPADWVANVCRLDHANQRSLQRLGPKDLGRLLRDAFRSNRLADELGWRIAEKSDGNPFFAFEIIRSLREGQILTQSADGTWITTQVIRDIQVPSSILDLVHARMANLTDDERDLLEVASCCGYEFDPVLVAEAAGVSRIPALKRFGQIEKRHRLVCSLGRKLAFDHHQVQEAVYEGILEALREDYNAAIAVAYVAREERAGREADAYEPRIRALVTRHALRGGRGDLAAPHVLAALDYLGGQYDWERQVALASRALDVPSLLAGDVRVNTLLKRAKGLGRLGRTQESVESYQLALDTAGEGENERLVVHAMRVLSDMLRRAGDLARARELAERSLAVATRLGSPLARDAKQSIANIERLERHPDRARALFEETAEECRAREDWDGLCTSLGNLCSLAWERGEPDTTRRHGLEAIDAAQRAGRADVIASTKSNLAGICWGEGQYAQGLELDLDAFQISKEMGDRMRMHWAARNVVHCLLGLGDLASAGEWLERAEKIWLEARGVASVAEHGYVHGILQENSGNLDVATASYREALSDLERGGLEHSPMSIQVRQALARRVADEGDGEAAELLFRQLLEDTGKSRMPHFEILAMAGFCQLGQGAPDAASDALAAMGTRLGAAHRMEAEFQLWRATKEPGRLREAHRLLEGIVDQAPEEYRESMMENVWLHREIQAAWEVCGQGEGA